MVTDQRAIVRGGCVAPEKAGETAKILRISPASCERANARAIAAAAEENAEEAGDRFQPKQKVVNATAADEFDCAKTKINLLSDN